MILIAAFVSVVFMFGAVESSAWPTSTLAAEGLDSTQIGKVTGLIRDQTFKNIHSFLIARNGKLIHEAYFTGVDGRRGEVAFTRDTPHHFRSVTKSVTSLLIGIAIDKGYIDSVEDPIAKYFPQHAQLLTDKQDITIKHLLTMRAGLEWDQSGHPETGQDEQDMEKSDDFVEFVLRYGISEVPGKRFNYNSGCTILLAGIIKAATGVHADVFADQHLLGPLGITERIWWPTKTGLPQTHAGLIIRPRDAVKIGQLCLNEGKWGDRQIVSSSWIEESR